VIVRVVAKAMEDFGDDWHWVQLHDPEPVGDVRSLAWKAAPSLLCSRVTTGCGIELDAGPVTVTLNDTGAPPRPTCPDCLLPERLTEIVHDQVNAILAGLGR